jgi:Domain of unknown function (DUF4359)
MIQDFNPNRECPQPTMPKPTKQIFACKCLGATALMLGIGGLGWTNPDQNAYELFLTRQATDLLNREVCDRPTNLPAFLQQAVAEQCASLAESGAKNIREFVATNSYRHNFIVFSLYTTDLPFRQIRAIGIAKNFILFDPS